MTFLKKLPLGVHEFSKIREKDYLYVDKTSYIHQMITGGEAYFLSRPRRFGKSLLVSTLEALYQGKRELFKDLYIEDRWDWKPRPVIHLDMLAVKNQTTEALERGLISRLNSIARTYGVQLTEIDSTERFRELIEILSEQGRVAVLIDEYDKPILDQITNLELVESIRTLMASFYAVLKQAGKYIDFILITGVSKFSKISLFSDLNNLEDLTLDQNYAGLAGYTQEEIDTYFAPYLEQEINGFFGSGPQRSNASLVQRLFLGWGNKNLQSHLGHDNTEAKTILFILVRNRLAAFSG